MTGPLPTPYSYRSQGSLLHVGFQSTHGHVLRALCPVLDRDVTAGTERTAQLPHPDTVSVAGQVIRPDAAHDLCLQLGQQLVAPGPVVNLEEPQAICSVVEAKRSAHLGVVVLSGQADEWNQVRLVTPVRDHTQEVEGQGHGLLPGEPDRTTVLVAVDDLQLERPGHVDRGVYVPNECSPQGVAGPAPQPCPGLGTQ